VKAQSLPHLAVVPTTELLNTFEFIQDLLTVSGPYWMLAYQRHGSKGMVHESFASREATAARITELDTAGFEVWHAVASFMHRHEETKEGGGDRWGRKKENVNALSAFYLDIDVDPDKPGKAYPTIGEAEEGIARFVEKFGESYHCLVHSGGGLHVYWMLDEDVACRDWERVAIKFKDATKIAGLLADPSRTADATSLLRPAGTVNKKPKYGKDGSPVEGSWCRFDRLSLDTFESACERFSRRGVLDDLQPSGGGTMMGTTLAVIPPRHWFDDLSQAARFQTLRSMLASLPIEHVSDRTQWLAVGAALAGVKGVARDICFDLWVNWSQSTAEGAKSWAEDSVEEHRIRWNGFDRSGVDALITRAKTAGWLPEMLSSNSDGLEALPAVIAALDASGDRWSMEQARKYMAEHVIFVSVDNQYIHDGLPLSRESLDTSLAPRMPLFKSPVTASGLLKKGFGRIVDYIGYKPGAPRTFIDGDNRKIANTWTPHPIEPVKPTREEMLTFARVVKHIGGGNSETDAGIKRYFTILAYLFLHPSARISHVTLLTGRHEGCGKSTLTEAIPRALFGAANVRTVETRELSSDFNSYAHCARVLVFPELWLGRRKDAEDQANHLKPLITDDRIAVVKKGKDGRMVENCTTIFASSNHEDAAFFSTNDRRYDVISTDALRMPPELSKCFYALINDRPGALLWLCLEYGKGAASFDPHAPPPQSAAKRAMIEANRGSWAQRMRDTFETHDWPFNGDVVAVSDVIILLGEEYRPAPSHKAILAELLSMADGSFNLLAQRRNSSGMKQKRVIVLRNVNNWKAAGATAIYSHYEETVIKYSRPQF
jgi:hypothetical protein